MDNYSMKTVAFGGFDKQDVVRYIEQSAKQATAAQKELQDKLDTLQNENSALANELASLRAQLEESNAQRDQLQAALEQETAARMALEPLKGLEGEMAQLKAEADALRPDAQAYAQFRERLGAIECEARKRATDLEAASAAQLKQTLDLFREQYQILMSTFETTASYVNGELRKMEVNLTQLPRAMDRSGSELNELAAQLDRIKEAKN